jgi:hypothetical protein
MFEGLMPLSRVAGTDEAHNIFRSSLMRSRRASFGFFTNAAGGALLVLSVLSPFAFAQWLNYPTPDIPRTPDGKPNLFAAVPRTPDDKPDLSGIWRLEKDPFKYLRNIAADFKPGESFMQPWAAALTKERMSGIHASEDPAAHCLPPGIPILDNSSAAGYPLKIVQGPKLVMVLYEALSQFRQIFLDGRPLPTDPNPTWLGYSVGRWERDVLVVDTTGFNGKTWLDLVGHPSTEALHVTERLRRLDFGHLNLQLTIDDPKAYTKLWTVTLTMQLAADTDLLEYVCENEKDLKHLVGK